MCLVNSFKDVQFVKIDQIVQSLFRIFQLIYNAHTTTFDISIVCIILLHNQIKSKSKSSAHLFDVLVLHTAILLSFSFVLAKKNQIQVRKHSSLRVKLWSDIQNVFIDCFFFLLYQIAVLEWYCTENYLYIYKMYFYTCTKIHLLIERSRFYHWLTSKQARNILLYVRVFNVVFSCSNEVRKKVKEENNKWLSIRFMWGEYIYAVLVVMCDCP